MGMTHDGGGGLPRPKLFPAAGKPCGYCKSAAALLFCRVESTFMCIPCDSKVHNATNMKHERVWMCEVCEQAPAVVTCKADAAALCVTCDRDIHSANPLASRHDRVPVVPFYDTVESAAVADSDASLFADGGYSWIPTSPIAAPKDAPPDLKAMELFFQDSDQFIDFDSYQISSQPYSDSVVSSSSMDVGVVPDGSSLSEISYPFGRNISVSNPDLTGNQSSQMDREARVLRYKEKRKNRKFEKTIRYASRKAYAETRPRIKGRFAKRTDSESDIDRIFGAGAANFIADARFGIVPSF
ncbi:hypothetical protein SASPL_108968 [Salvia splendens]|uniref:Zinc finger protein CONSTANS n=1 Tax=Salvia splendens TaxID=180675 RepID=A0A8X8YJ39_SALSN|nr:hypothetical protein SASPL_108968 [Salvia splendens]